MCLACGSWQEGPLCTRCRRSLHRASDTVLPGGLRVRSAYLHEGCARTLVHRLKYQGITAAARLLADRMANRVEGVEALVPVPRVLSRRVRYGIDQAEALATALSRATNLPVARLLASPLWTRRLAGRSAGTRSGPRFRSRRALGSELGLALIDDVLTTGVTLQAAARALPVPPRLALTATAARVRSGR